MSVRKVNSIYHKMRKIIVMIVVPFNFLFPQILLSQSFSIGHIQKTYTDASRSNRSVSCEIYYPSLTNGDNVPVSSGVFPVLVFGHGFLMDYSAYDVLWNSLVQQGYIMVFPTTETGFSPSHTNFAGDMSFLTHALKSEGNDALSVFYGRVDTACALMGHSMGGGCAFLAMETDTTITAMATLAAAVTNPSSVTAALQINKPALVISGGNDCVAPAAAHQLPMYDSLASVCKSFISITGGSHCQFASSNFYCTLGESTCTPQPAISAGVQQELTDSLLLPWLNFYLRSDCAAADTFQSRLSAGMGITAQQNCVLACVINDIDDAKRIQLVVYPNPTTGRITIESARRTGDAFIRIFDSWGREVYSGTFAGSGEIVLPSYLRGGVYRVTLENKSAEVMGSTKFILVDKF